MSRRAAARADAHDSKRGASKAEATFGELIYSNYHRAESAPTPYRVREPTELALS
jgi:hypothetical protein